MRVVVAISSSIFVLCALALVYRRLLFALMLALSFTAQPQMALAACTTSTISLGDGSIKLCTTCCNQAGVCDTHCF
jgi:hypothetical protein